MERSEVKRDGPALECRQLSKIYGAVRALDQVDLTIRRGRIVGLLGPNGSGKTTLIKTAAGLLSPSAGELLVCGQRPSAATKGLVSYLPERTYLNDWMRVEDILSILTFRRRRRCSSGWISTAWTASGPCPRARGRRSSLSW